MHQMVRAAAYLRYMQEAAFVGSAAAGYSNERYVAMQRVWLIRENHVEFFDPLRYGDVLRLVTWVADFRRVRSQRVYELWAHNEDGDAPARSGVERLTARGLTDWVFVDTRNGHPAPIPDEMIAAFQPYAASDNGQERARFPTQKPPTEAISSRLHTVPWRELDSVGHVNNAVYGDYAENAMYEQVAALGWPPARLAETGLALAPQSFHIEYRQPAWFGDSLAVGAWLGEADAGGFVCHSTVRRVADQELLAQAFAAWRSVNLLTRAPRPLPHDLLTAISSVVC